MTETYQTFIAHAQLTALPRGNLGDIASKTSEQQLGVREIELETGRGRGRGGHRAGDVAVLVCAPARRTRGMRCRC